VGARLLAALHGWRRWGAVGLASATAIGLLGLEGRTSWVQSELFAAAARGLAYTVERGSSPSIRYPETGPYNLRLGYALLPDFVQRLTGSDFVVDEQARWSPRAVALADRGLFTIYREKGQAGLTVLDRAGRPMTAGRHPERAYGHFDEVPPLIVDTILFIENRSLLATGHSRRNPSVEYARLGQAVLDGALRLISPRRPTSGGSTIATQLEKVRHSHDGRTASVADKGRQMLSASLRAYRDGVHTRGAREQLVVDYLNALPLGAVGGHGEVTGLGDGLWAWYDADILRINELLSPAALVAAGNSPSLEQATAYRQVLSLLLAIKKPSTYLRDPDSLDTRVGGYLGALTKEGIVPPALGEAARRVQAAPRRQVPLPTVPFAERKAVDRVRTELLGVLGLSHAYDLDRLDLTVSSTLDAEATDGVTASLQQLSRPDYARDAGLVADRLLGPRGLDKVLYSFTLYERGESGHLLRVQADNYDGPLNLNEGTRLELGSTAKLRTLVTYLEIIEGLHQQYGAEPADRLGALRPHSRDRLARWAIGYLAAAADRSLDAMLEAALARRYSASPAEAFFTGGGLHRFRNFDAKDDGLRPTVSEAFERSVNLVFIRVMRDIVDHLIYRHSETARVLDDPEDPGRRAYLERFADQEGREFLRRFHARHANASSADLLRHLAQARPVTRSRLAVIFRTVRPEAGPGELAEFLAVHGAAAGLTERQLTDLFDQYDPGRWNLQDLGYLARVHPLELWLAAYLHRHPAAALADVLEASADARQEAYRWLLSRTSGRARQRAVQTMAERDAFDQIHASWQRVGYPFASLVPSYATALGSSGDNAAALADLAGTILGGGVRGPAVRFDELVFGEGTPYHSRITRAAADGERVLSPEAAAILKRGLVDVVERGTGRRLAGGVEIPGLGRLAIGGKTGTGDNRFTSIGPAGRSSRVVNRTAAFVFTIGDRHFGTIVAFVPGAEAADYRFTSALPVQVFKHLLPAVGPVLQQSAAEGS
jgi:membrane peptidoglycan carboxypeptidase